MSRRHKHKVIDHDLNKRPIYEANDDDTKPDWSRKCEVCGQTPIVPFTGLCGPCTFGEADTAGGNW